MKDTGTRAERFEARVRRRWFLVLLSLITLIISAVATIVGTGAQLYRWYEREHNWREAEVRKLQGLKAGFTLEHFRKVLGAPLFAAESRPEDEAEVKKNYDQDRAAYPDAFFSEPLSGLTSFTFKGRGFWVQAVVGTDGIVLGYAITACDNELRPMFDRPDARAITVNQDTFASLGGKGTELNYFTPGATANAYYVEYVYGGNPSNYQTFGWGLNDACPNFRTRVNESEGGAPIDPDFLDSWEYQGDIADAPVYVRRFRDRAIVNTYAETAPVADFQAVFFDYFQVGPDRIQVRTLRSGEP